MRKICNGIIFIIFIFSSMTQGYAQSMDELLNLDDSVEIIELKTKELPKITFSQAFTQKKYNDFVSLDTELRNAFLSEYRKENISYYGMQDIIQKHANFVYYTQKTFEYLAEKEKGYDSKEIDEALKNAYTNVRTAYLEVKQEVEKQKLLKEDASNREEKFSKISSKSSNNYDYSYYDEYYKRTYYYENDSNRYYYYNSGYKYSCSRSYSSYSERYTYSCYKISSDSENDADEYDYSYYDEYYKRYYYYNSGSSRYYYYDDGKKYSCSRSYSSSRDRYSYSCNRISGYYEDDSEVEIKIEY